MAIKIAKLVAEYRVEEFSSAVVPYIALKEVAHGMVCLSESRQEVNFRGDSELPVLPLCTIALRSLDDISTQSDFQRIITRNNINNIM